MGFFARRCLTHARTLVALFVAMMCVAGQSHAAAAPANLERDVRSYLRPLLDTNNFSGVILVAQGDEVVFASGYGRASIEHNVPNGANTVFQIASVSKPFTAAAVMLLAEQGKINLRAPLSNILPGYPQGDRLTVHHLLSHTSGIPNINDFPTYDEIQPRGHTPEELVAYFRDMPLEFEPGARYSYSNSNYNLLALIIEKVSRARFGDFLRHAIFQPLDLRRIGHRGSASEIIPAIANGYAPSGTLGLERAPYLDWSVKTGNGSLYADAESVFRFVRGVHQGRLLNPQSLTATFTPHMPNTGYGWFLSSANGRDIHHINGRSPGFAAQVDYYVADGVTVVVLANTYVSVTTEIARAVGAMTFQTPVTPMPDLRPDPLSAAQTAALVGEYQFGPDYFVPNALMTIRARDGHLEAMTGEYGPFPMIRISPTRFLLRSFWINADFTLGRDGRATQLVIDGRTGVRMPAR